MNPSMLPVQRAAVAWPAVLSAVLLAAGAHAAVSQGVVLEDRSAAVGLDFVHFNGMSGELYFPEMTGQGAALFDYDGDGDLDIYLVQGTMIGPGKKLEDALVPPKAPGVPRDRLLRNELVGAGGETAKAGELRFTDVTETSGLQAAGYGMGVAAGDIDNDGHVDLYVTNYGPNELWGNRGDGTFERRSEPLLDDPRWSTSASFLDFDGDGWLDLFVANYVDFDLVKNPACYANSSRRDYCGPASFRSQEDRLLRNRGDGTFEDATGLLGPHAAGAGLGVTAADFDGDGRLDIFVANDGQANHLWLQQGNGRFVEDALLVGVALNRGGEPEASMGVAVEDVDGDGRLDLFLTHLSGETNTLYRNVGDGLFEDRSVESGVAAASLPYTGFGTSFFDLDNDGRPDLLVLNGAVKLQDEGLRRGEIYPLGQPNQLFLNGARGRFEEVAAEAAPALALSEVSRGAAFGDVDNDGDVDVLVLNNNGPARLLINGTGQDAQWLGLKIVEGTVDRDALGAVVEIVRRGAPSLWRRVHTDGSYASASDPRITLGLGDGKAAVQEIRVLWTDGAGETFPAPPAGAYGTLRRGTGKKVGEDEGPGDAGAEGAKKGLEGAP